MRLRVRSSFYSSVNRAWLTSSALTDKSLKSQKTSFDWSVKIARWLSTYGLKIILQIRYSKTPVFALPADWFPYYVEWILSLPRAPLGSVSIHIWGNVCATTVGAIADILTPMLLDSQAAKAQAVPAGEGKKS